tara:strand:- start:1761 stop:2261 length:501 start_codon:yes stop_codon:yes gene_type:complete
MTTLANTMPAPQSPGGAWFEVTPGERFKIRISALDTEDVYATLEITAEPRNGVPMHTHANEEECFVVVEGSLSLVNGAQKLTLSAGDVATVKRGTPHAWANLSDSKVRFLVIFAPGNMEKTFRRISAMTSSDFAAISESAESDGSTIIGPPPFDDIYSVMSPRPGL